MRVQGLPSGANLADLKFERTFLFHSTIPVSDVPKRGVKLMERQSRSSSIFLYHSVDSSESGVCVRGAQMHFNIGLHLRNLKDFRGQCSSSASWIEFAQRGAIWKIQIIRNFDVILTCVCQVWHWALYYYSFFFFSSVNPLTWGFCEEQSSASLSLLLDFAIPISDNNTQMKRAVTFMDKDDCKIVLKFPFFSPLDSGHIVPRISISRIDLFIVMPSNEDLGWRMSSSLPDVSTKMYL